MDGWLKLHRSLIFSRQFQNEYELKIWIWLLCKAYSRDGFATITTGRGKRTIAVKRGQLIFGRISAAKQLEMDESMVYRIIQRFKEDGCILIEVNSQYSIISLTKYNDFQRRQDEEFTDIEDGRTGDEQALNMQGTGNEQASDSRRTGVEHNKEGFIKGEYKEGSEGEEGEKGLPDAIAPASPFPPVLPEDPAAKPTTPSGSAPVSPSKSDVKRKAREDLEGRFLDIYSEWMKDVHGIKPLIDGAQVNAAKQLIAYFRTIVVDNATAKQVTLDVKGTEEGILAGWRWILSQWEKIDPFYQDKTKLIEIRSNIQNIFKQAKQNGTTKQQSGNNRSPIQQAEGVVAAIIRRNSGNGNGSPAGSREAI